MGVERVWVVVESTGGRPRRVGLELLTAARQVASVVEAVHWGPGAEAVAPELGRYGASRVLSVGDFGAALPGVPVAAAVAARARRGERGERPDAVFLATTRDQRDVAGRLSARLDRPVLTNVVALAPGPGLVAEHAASGGSTLVRACITAPPPHLLVFRPRSVEAVPLAAALDPVVEALPVPATGHAGRAVVRRRLAEGDTGGPDLDEATVVVAGGRGVGGRPGFAMVERLARRLGGAPAATRAAVDAGWAPFEWQVGQTGRTVAPAVYVACGISGAMHHVVGMRGAGHIVAINKDARAPIFSMADLGVVGDVTELLPRLIEALGEPGDGEEGRR